MLLLCFWTAESTMTLLLSALRWCGQGQKHSQERDVLYCRETGLQLLSEKSVASHWNEKKPTSSDINFSVLVKSSILPLPLTRGLT